ncbi:hypothetical protein [Kineococcus xinjiangensis]|uniref:hypothetical protein n=1 Tax=Kineococcus xinjiangensis TaxID=512762 RepID=UPI0011B08F9B|nr:hypothetical protein [Kineococcus xinjiangensis]
MTSRTRSVVLVGAVLGASLLPLVVLLVDVASVLGGAYDDALPPSDEGSLLAGRIGTALLTVSVVPTLLVAAVGVAVPAAAVLAGGRSTPGRLLRAVAAATATLLVLVALATALATVLGFGWGGYRGLGPSYAAVHAPTLGPLVFVAVFAAAELVVLVRGARW